jgi:hypothetical protein
LSAKLAKLMKKSTLILLVTLLIGTASLAQIPANDASMYKITMPNYSKFVTLPITGVFRNSGTDTLRSVIINYTVNGGTVHRFTKDSLSIPRSQNWPFVTPDPLNITAEGDWKIKIWTSAPNGATDEKTSNDTLEHVVQVVREYPAKNILIEEVTGAWCGYCPRAPIIYKKTIEPVVPNTIFVAIHTGDAMAITDSREFTNTYVTGVPCGFVNRTKLTADVAIDYSPEEWLNLINHTDQEFNPAVLNVYNYYDPVTGDWKIDVVADFIFNMTGNFRLNCYILEDSLKGTGSSWDQRNFFNSGATDPYRELQGAGDPIPGYYHNHVVRKMLGGSWGQAGIIPSQVSRGDRYVFSKTFKMDSKWKPGQLHVVGILQLYDADKLRRQILNSVEAPLSYATGAEQIQNSRSVTLFPNPSSDQATLQLKNFGQEDLTLKVINISGQEMTEQVIANPGISKTISLDLRKYSAGIYFVRISGPSGQNHLKLIKQ